MEAMILAAGKGQRLRPLTETTPKALIEVGGEALLGIVAGRLVAAGVHRIVVNAHYLADRVAEFLSGSPGLGVPVALSREDEVSAAPLDTGGGLWLARDRFESDEPFFIHNADILTDVDLGALYREHRAAEARDGRLATLVVARRPTGRPLLVDARGICGRANRAEGWEVVARHPAPGGEVREVGFAGVQVVSPRIFPRIKERGTFSLIDVYLRLIAERETIGFFDATDATWHDIGTIERLEAARADRSLGPP